MVQAIPILGPGLTRIRRDLYSWRRDPLRLMKNTLRGRRNLVVVQVGSNDGKTGDPLHPLLQSHTSWRALLIEPVPYLYRRLRGTYGSNPRFQFAQVAVGEKEGTAEFYCVANSARTALPDLPEWFDQLGAFNPEHIEKHFGDRIRPYIEKLEIPTARLETILRQHQIDRIDVLHIDTEGSDWMILRQLDLRQFKPRVIMIEHVHLSEHDKEAVRQFLAREYKLFPLLSDYFFTRR